MQACSCEGGDAVVWTQDGGEWLMVREQGELLSIQELMKAFDSEHQCQCYLLQLCIVLLNLYECVRGIADWALSAIWLGL